ncbi:hypothetical protein [Bradyrhizobium sp. Gha]|uniref:hypothetical protein n=1 Tax=Bradyrhizobium sp. Gha TaxID=1855318 RepID=UPI0008F13307|nr:hypothetical protein [Bradyrhizobium sp. Gha]SFK23080.1 hypothetical protein SAMN05216525_16623 [Bradyrhizobium sp. Gha]
MTLSFADRHMIVLVASTKNEVCKCAWQSEYNNLHHLPTLQLGRFKHAAGQLTAVRSSESSVQLRMLRENMVQSVRMTSLDDARMRTRTLLDERRALDCEANRKTLNAACSTCPSTS